MSRVGGSRPDLTSLLSPDYTTRGYTHVQPCSQAKRPSFTICALSAALTPVLAAKVCRLFLPPLIRRRAGATTSQPRQRPSGTGERGRPDRARCLPGPRRPPPDPRPTPRSARRLSATPHSAGAALALRASGGARWRRSGLRATRVRARRPSRHRAMAEALPDLV